MSFSPTRRELPPTPSPAPSLRPSGRATVRGLVRGFACLAATPGRQAQGGRTSHRRSSRALSRAGLRPASLNAPATAVRWPTLNMFGPYDSVLLPALSSAMSNADRSRSVPFGLVQRDPKQAQSRGQRASCIDPDRSWSCFPQRFERLDQEIGVAGPDQAVVDQVFCTSRDA